MAARYYERATELDPAYALAWVGLSRARNWQTNIGSIAAEEGQRLALGRKKEADAALRELVTKYHAGAAYQIAEVYAFRNQSDEAFECLNSL
jgi:tetratricopeptide (TPR) repeat protein